MRENKSFLPPPLVEYLCQANPPLPEPLQTLYAHTKELKQGHLMVSRESLLCLQFLTKICAPRKILELGTYTGVTAMALALAAGEHATVTTVDINDDYLALAQQHWRLANVDERIMAEVSNAHDYLDTQLFHGPSAVFDFIFIDADKASYPTYYEKAMSLLYSKGIMVLDNMLLKGKVWDIKNNQNSTQAIRETTEQIQSDDRIETFWLSGEGDGLLILRKK